MPCLQDMVETVVKFSRCLYAQLVTQHYETPLDLLMPLPSEPSFPAAQLGAKLTAGFELLLARALNNPSQGAKGLPQPWWNNGRNGSARSAYCLVSYSCHPLMGKYFQMYVLVYCFSMHGIVKELELPYITLLAVRPLQWLQ